jgi:hypothetical protein
MASEEATDSALTPYVPEHRQVARGGQDEHLCLVNPWLPSEVAAQLASGMPMGLAVALFGVHPRTAQKWLEKGAASDDPTDPNRAFFLITTAAKAEFVRAALRRIRTKSGERDAGREATSHPGDWKAELTVLERLCPEYFAKQTVLTTSTAAGRLPFDAIDPSIPRD